MFMKRITKHHKRLRYVRLKFALLVVFVNIILFPSYEKYELNENNFFHVYLNGEKVGDLGNVDGIQELLVDARRELGAGNDSIIYVDTELTYEGESVIFAEVDSRRDVKKRMVEVLKGDVQETLLRAYTVRIGDYTANLASAEDVIKVLQAALNLYEDDGEYVAQLVTDTGRELNAMTVAVVTDEEAQTVPEEKPVTRAGISEFLMSALEEEDEKSDALDFDDFEYGIQYMNFDDNIEIVDSYVTSDQLTTVEEAIASVVTVQEVNTIYEVQDGDTLSEIAIKTEIPMDKIIELNESLEDERSVIRSGDELIITTTEPPITVRRIEQEYVEEIYDAEIQYVDNDDWYTTEHATLQQPSAGRRNIVAQVTYENDKVVSREVIKEEVLLEAVPKIVERGTKIPPTYIKPLSGGRLSSGFGGRKAPTKGASTNHKGIDWATPVGTAIYASSGGVVTKAGWGSGYGYCVYIKHPDGKETRYGHLSKVLVSAGQSVKQGQKIALSGNTGRSTGPHLHFEIRIGGTAVNPLKYLN